MLGYFFLFLAMLVVVGAFLLRSRHSRAVRGDDPVVADDPVLRAILSDAEPGDGEPEAAEPLDEGEIREAEDRFWEEEWDEPEEWRG